MSLVNSRKTDVLDLGGTVHAKRARRAVAMIAGLAAAPAMATTYYVSPVGSDLNAGTSAASPWGSVAKVNATTFLPGDQVNFQYGSTWNASLTASSSGSAAAPVTYSAYGNSALGNPTFSGSNPISTAAFTPLSGTTYQTTATFPVNWIFDNHQFTHEAQDALTQSGSKTPTDPATDIAYVQSTAHSFYYNSVNNQLYVNLGSSLTGHTITAATRDDAISSNSQSNLVFSNLNTTETALDQAGYGIRVQASSNVQVINATATLAGKHSIGVIDSTGFKGTNLVADGSAPDQGFSGASAFVAFSDANPSRPNNQNNTSQWTNLLYKNAGGAYPAFITHGETGAIGSVSIKNIVSLNGYGTGIDVQSTGPTETVVIDGGKFNGGAVSVNTNNSVVNGLTLTGSTGVIAVSGTHDVVQNNVLNGLAPNPQSGIDGAVIDAGTSNTIRFNTFKLTNFLGPAIALENANDQSNIYGNIIAATAGGGAQGVGLYYVGTNSFSSTANLFGAYPFFYIKTAAGDTYPNLAQWQAMGYDLNSAVGDPLFTDAANGDFSLTSGSAAYGLYTGVLDPSLVAANALLAPPNFNGSYNAGIDPPVTVPEPATVATFLFALPVLFRRRRTHNRESIAG